MPFIPTDSSLAHDLRVSQDLLRMALGHTRQMPTNAVDIFVLSHRSLTIHGIGNCDITRILLAYILFFTL